MDGQTYANYGDLITLGESDQTSKKVDAAGGDQPSSGSQGSGSGDSSAKALPDTGEEGLIERIARAFGA